MFNCPLYLPYSKFNKQAVKGLKFLSSRVAIIGRHSANIYLCILNISHVPTICQVVKGK